MSQQDEDVFPIAHKIVKDALDKANEMGFHVVAEYWGQQTFQLLAAPGRRPHAPKESTD